MLRGVLPILQDRRPGFDWWSFGGGTSLAVHLDHRISYDIDLFLDSARDLRSLTPAANPLVKAFQGDLMWEYPGNYLKLYRPGGEVDFIVAAPKTTLGTMPWSFDGHTLLIDTPVETAIKKIFYRPSTFKIRDVFDVAAILGSGFGDDLRAALNEVSDRLPLVRDRLDLIAPIYEQEAVNDINPTEKGRRWLTRAAAVDPLIAFLG